MMKMYKPYSHKPYSINKAQTPKQASCYFVHIGSVAEQYTEHWDSPFWS